jgi:tRNA(Ile)-lysidine synthase
MKPHFPIQLPRLAPGERLWVSLSGGVDSKVLLHRLVQERRWRRKCPLELCAVHLRHHLETDEPRWQADCEDYCETLEVPLTILPAPSPRHGEHGLEAEARYARLRAWKNLASESLINAPHLHSQRKVWIALAHHANDRAETLIHRMGRGTGVQGLAVLPYCQTHPLDSGQVNQTLSLCRPLLYWPKDRILHYAECHHIKGADDPANHDTQRTRARIRHELMPIMESIFPGWLIRAEEMSAIAQMEAQALRHYGQRLMTDGLVCADHALLRLPWKALAEAEQSLVFRHWLSEMLHRHAHKCTTQPPFVMPSFRRLQHLIAMILSKPQGDTVAVPNAPLGRLIWTRDKIIALAPGTIKNC